MTADQAAYIAELEVDNLQDLIDAAASEAPPSQTSTARKAAIAEAIRTDDLDELIALQEKLEGVVDRILANRIDPEDASLLSEEQLIDLMLEALDQQDVKRLLEIRYQMLRTRIFNHITEDNRSKGASDPEHTPGEIPVVALQRRFTREGGKARVTLDHDKLIEKLGEQRAAEIFRTEVIPEHTEIIPEQRITNLNENALLALVRREPAVMEMVRDCVVTDGYTPARFHIRSMK